MTESHCPQCGFPIESGSYLPGLIYCQQCNFKGAPSLSAAKPVAKHKTEESESDSFNEELGPLSISSKMAFISLFAFFVVSLVGLHNNFSLVFFVGFLIFSISYIFLRVRNRN